MLNALRDLRGLFLTFAVVFAVIVALIIGLWAAGIIALDPSQAQFRYRLDLMLSVDGESVTGSSVYETTLKCGGGDGSGTISRVVMRFKGQALTMAIPGRPMLVIPVETPGESMASAGCCSTRVAFELARVNSSRGISRG